MSHLDFAELEQGQDCLVDLKLFNQWKDQQTTVAAAAAMVSSSFSSSSKKARALSGGDPRLASCLVDGCVSDLSKCREYHRRHKVCEVHSKIATVMVGGREQRFCQQCSRFHLLMEFDEAKRSCRKRLEGHNRRRRKPQLPSLNSGPFMTNHQGPCLLTGTRFTSYPQIFSVTAAESNRDPVVKAEGVPLYTYHSPRHLISGHYDYEHFPVSSHGIYKDGKRFPFLQENVQAAPASACQPLTKNFSAIGLQNNSACALSLLSSPEACSSHVYLCQYAATGDRIPTGQPVIPSMQCDGLGQFYGSQAFNSVSATGFLCSGIEHEHDGTVLISDSSDEFQSHGSFHVGGEGSSDGIPQTLSFSWQ